MWGALSLTNGLKYFPGKTHVHRPLRKRVHRKTLQDRQRVQNVQIFTNTRNQNGLTQMHPPEVLPSPNDKKVWVQAIGTRTQYLQIVGKCKWWENEMKNKIRKFEAAACVVACSRMQSGKFDQNISQKYTELWKWPDLIFGARDLPECWEVARDIKQKGFLKKPV
jgi:hypothetical protein